MEEKTRNGPAFITDWVQTYLHHSGVMEFKPEVFLPDNFPYLLSFGRENDSIKSISFSDEFIFANNPEKNINLVA